MSDEKKRRAKGDGGLRYRADKDRWEVTVDYGTRPVYDAHGQPVLTASGTPKMRRERRVVTAKSKAAALIKKRELEGERAPGPLAHGAPVGAFLDRWLLHLEATLKAENPRTWVSYEATVRLHIRPVIGHIKLAALSPADVERVSARALGAGHRRTAIYARDVLRIALNWGMRQEYVTRNVAAIAAVPEDRPRGRVTLSVADARRIVAAPHRYRVLWLVALTTGLRQAELCGLRWQDVDLTAGRLVVSQQLQRVTGRGLVPRPLKTRGSEGMVLLAPFVVQAMREHRARGRGGDALVFVTTRGTAIDPRNLQRQWTMHLARLGIAHVNFHAATRHTCASFLFAAGVEMRIIQSVLRHTRIATTSDVYTHLGEDAQLPAARAMQTLFATDNRLTIPRQSVRKVHARDRRAGRQRKGKADK